MDNEKKQVTYNSSFSGETQVTLDIQQYMNNKAMYIGLMCNEDGYDEPFGDVTVNLHRGTCNAVDGGAVGGHDLLGQLFQCSAADALGLLCTFQFAVGNGAVGIHGQGGSDSAAKAVGRAGLGRAGSGGAAAAAGGQRDANNEAHGHGSAQFADDLLFHGSFLQRKIGLCSVPRKGHIFSRMFTKDNIFCEVLSRDFSTYFVKNDKLVSICDADGIKKPETNVQRSVPGRRKR